MAGGDDEKQAEDEWMRRGDGEMRDGVFCCGVVVFTASC
jgi:hypothetical protein